MTPGTTSNPTFAHAPGTPQCNAFECVYRPYNIASSELVVELLDVVYHGIPPVPPVTLRQTSDTGGVAFYDPDQSTMAALRKLVIEYDTLSEFHSQARVLLGVEIFAVDSNLADTLMATIQLGSKPAVTPALDRASGAVSALTGVASVYGVIGNIATNFIKAQLDIGLTNGVRKMKDSFSFESINGGAITYSKPRVVYRDGNSVTTIKETVGLSFSGTPVINGLDTNVVRIRDFSFTYGVATHERDSIVSGMNLSLPYVDIARGSAYVMTSNELTIENRFRKRSFLGGGHQNTNSTEKLVILISVTPLPAIGK